MNSTELVKVCKQKQREMLKAMLRTNINIGVEHDMGYMVPHDSIPVGQEIDPIKNGYTIRVDIGKDKNDRDVMDLNNLDNKDDNYYYIVLDKNMQQVGEISKRGNFKFSVQHKSSFEGIYKPDEEYRLGYSKVSEKFIEEAIYSNTDIIDITKEREKIFSHRNNVDILKYNEIERILEIQEELDRMDKMNGENTPFAQDKREALVKERENLEAVTGIVAERHGKEKEGRSIHDDHFPEME